jgi:EAL domain-containing protein (putative c-di-GMP-specific phosphodiesterase class I)
MVERLCLVIDRVRERGGKAFQVSIPIEAACFETKKFVGELLKLLNKYSIKDDLICLVVEESGLLELEGIDYTDIFAILRKGGYRMAINSMKDNSTLVTSLDSLEIDYLFIHPSYTKRLNANANAFGVASGVLEIAHNLHVSVVFLGTDTSAIEKTLLKMHARLAAGDLYGIPLREQEMVSLIASDGGDA